MTSMQFAANINFRCKINKMFRDGCTKVEWEKQLTGDEWDIFGYKGKSVIHDVSKTRSLVTDAKW